MCRNVPTASYIRSSWEVSPRLILNSTAYNTGQRVALTTLPAAEFDYNFVTTVLKHLPQDDSPAGREQRVRLERSLAQAREHFQPMTFDALKAGSRSLPVAGSASLPLVVGPVTYAVSGHPPYLHMGDGGLFDNLGTESLMTVFLKRIPSGESQKRGLIIVIDIGYGLRQYSSCLRKLVCADDPRVAPPANEEIIQAVDTGRTVLNSPKKLDSAAIKVSGETIQRSFPTKKTKAPALKSHRQDGTL